MTRLLLPFVVCAALSPGCVQYNEACTAPVDNATDSVAKLKDPIYIDKPNARHANNAFGQAAADAFRHAFDGSPAEAQVGVINAGDIRSEGFCEPRNILKGQIRTSDVYEVLLFDNLVYSAELTEARLVAALQHAVNSLTPATTAGAPQEIAAPPARFLQVSEGVELNVNCKNPSGTRVTSLKINGKAVDLAAPSTTTKYRVAMPEFLLLGGDGYVSFKAAYDDGVWSQTPRNQKEAELTAEHLLKNFGPDKELAAQPRVTFKDPATNAVTCAIPLPPAG